MISLPLFWSFLRLNLQNTLAYPIMIAIWMFESVFLPFVMLFVWLTAMEGESGLASSRQQIINFYLLFPIIYTYIGSWHGIFLGRYIKDGFINSRLLKPIPIWLYNVGNNIGEKLIKTFFIVPILLVMMWLFNLTPSLSMGVRELSLFSITFIMAAVLAYLFETMIGELAFWTSEISGIRDFEKIMAFIFGGEVIPVFLFPPFLKVVGSLLPFRYYISFPAEVLSGALSTPQILEGIGIQVVWVAVLSMVTIWLWRTGIKRYGAIGG